DMEDLISIGTIGLIKAIKTYNGDRGVRLATYAARCIENEVLMHLRNIKKVRQEVSIYDPIGYDKEGNEISLLDVLTVDNEIVDMVEMKLQEEKVRNKIGVLSQRERQVIE
ncbi:MAG TPA: RNA polymerase subunit sigma-70, partial [Syntrophomonas sp.]|nr:RNA polymerase subunit sigma-70 [Syntrophomonas sp.]